jgi:biotin carboxyl carrier protein
VVVAATAYDLAYPQDAIPPPWSQKPYNPWLTKASPLTQQELTLTFDYSPAGYNPDQKGTQEVQITVQRSATEPMTWRLKTGNFDQAVTLQPHEWESVRLGTVTTERQEWHNSNAEQAAYYKDQSLMLVEDGNHLYRFLRPRPLSTDTLATAVHLPHENSLEAPMPGKVIQVLVTEGDTVEENARLVVMEAMKMEFTIRAPHAGQVRRLPVSVGQLVDAGVVLVEIE